jgi:hypothetical protein
MAITVYPATGYNSFISQEDAAVYFSNRLNAGDYLDLTLDAQSDALVTAFRALQELDIVIDLTDAAALAAIRYAQCEQALHEAHDNIDDQTPLLQIQGIRVKKPETPRFSDRALGLLKPYMRALVLTRLR